MQRTETKSSSRAWQHLRKDFAPGTANAAAPRVLRRLLLTELHGGCAYVLEKRPGLEEAIPYRLCYRSALQSDCPDLDLMARGDSHGATELSNDHGVDDPSSALALDRCALANQLPKLLPSGSHNLARTR